MGFANAFVGCNLFNMYTKGGNKKIWHDMIIFVCDSKNSIKMNKYNIVSIFLGLILSWLNYNVIFWYDFHKVHMYATCTIVVMEAGGECMCYNTNAFESQVHS
jgi:hypothetical protein